MTFSLLNLIPTAAVDVVGVYDADFNQVFAGAQTIKATIKNDATLFRHPLEDGTEITDHSIFNPVEISLTAILSGNQYRNVYQQIKQAFRDRSQLIVQTRADSYSNMYISGMPHDETPDAYDAIIVSIQLQEAEFSTAEIVFSPANDADKTTKSRGQQEPVEPTANEAQQGSTLFRWFGQ